MKMERFAKRNKIVAEIIFKETNYTDWRNSSRHVKESYILYYVYSKFLSNTGTVQVRPHFTAVMRIRTSFNRIRIWIRIFKKLIESDFWSGPSCPDPDPDPTKKERIWISNRFVNKFFVLSFLYCQNNCGIGLSNTTKLLEDRFTSVARGQLHRSCESRKLHRRWKKTATNSSCQRTATQ